MPHDKNGTLLAEGDRVSISGVVQKITSEQSIFCNLAVTFDRGMEPMMDVDRGGEGYTMALSARMVEKVGPAGVIDVAPTDPAGFMGKELETILLPSTFQVGERVITTGARKGTTGKVTGVAFRGGVLVDQPPKVYYTIDPENEGDEFEVPSDDVAAAE